MGGIVAVFVVIWIIRGISGNRQQKVVASRAVPQGRLAMLDFVVWLVVFFAFLFSVGNTVATLTVLLLATTVLQPALWARLAVRLGWVRAAYFLGRSALWVNRRSLVGGGLFNGWCALQRHRDDAGRHAAGHAFLRGRLDRNARKMDSGALLMQIVLQRDEMAEERFYRRLLGAGGLDMACVPAGLTRYTFRLLAAHALARGEWENLMKAAWDWRRHCSVPLAASLEREYRQLRHDRPVRHSDRSPRRRKWRRPRWAAQLPAVAGPQALPLAAAGSGGQALRLQSWSLAGAAAPEAVAQAWQCELETPERLAAWQARARQLGCRDVDAAMAGVGQSLADWLERSAARAAGVVVAAADIDHVFDKLRFKARAIDNRQAQRKLLGGSLEFEEFLNLMELFDQFAGDPLRQHQAYGIFEYEVWNWMAALWNHDKEKWLAYFICARLHPYAKSVGSPAAVVYGQILSGEVR